MKIEVLGFDGCPNSPALLENTRAAAASVAPSVAVAYVDQKLIPESDVRRGYPAPTILVDGRDLFGLAASTRAALECRLYPDGLPSAEQIAAKLRQPGR
jgi:hypothetical protein